MTDFSEVMLSRELNELMNEQCGSLGQEYSDIGYSKHKGPKIRMFFGIEGITQKMIGRKRGVRGEIVRDKVGY